jgi:uncharacterized protein (UPF0332 family)
LLDLKGCIERGLVRRIPPSREHAAASLGKAGEMLKDARANQEECRFDAAALLAYVSVLNCARALLFRDGYTEKSHYCIARYLEAEYGSELGRGTILEIDSFRQLRHEVQYSAAYSASGEEGRKAVEFAEDFLSKVEALLLG